MKDYLHLLSLVHQVSDYSAFALETICPDYRTLYLLYLIKQEATNQKTLAKKLGMTEPALSMKLKTLENDGVISKVRSKKDKRHYELQITTKGLEWLESEETILNQQIQVLFSSLTKEEKIQLETILEKLSH